MRFSLFVIFCVSSTLIALANGQIDFDQDNYLDEEWDNIIAEDSINKPQVQEVIFDDNENIGYFSGYTWNRESLVCFEDGPARCFGSDAWKWCINIGTTQQIRDTRCFKHASKKWCVQKDEPADGANLICSELKILRVCFKEDDSRRVQVVDCIKDGPGMWCFKPGVKKCSKNSRKWNRRCTRRNKTKYKDIQCIKSSKTKGAWCTVKDSRKQRKLRCSKNRASQWINVNIRLWCRTTR